MSITGSIIISCSRVPGIRVNYTQLLTATNFMRKQISLSALEDCGNAGIATGFAVPAALEYSSSGSYAINSSGSSGTAIHNNL